MDKCTLCGKSTKNSELDELCNVCLDAIRAEGTKILIDELLNCRVPIREWRNQYGRALPPN